MSAATRFVSVSEQVVMPQSRRSRRNRVAHAAWLACTAPERRGVRWPEQNMTSAAPERSPGGARVSCPFRDGELLYFMTWAERAQHLDDEHGWVG